MWYLGRMRQKCRVQKMVQKVFESILLLGRWEWLLLWRWRSDSVFLKGDGSRQFRNISVASNLWMKGYTIMQNHFSFLNKRSILLDSSSYSLSKKWGRDSSFFILLDVSPFLALPIVLYFSRFRMPSRLPANLLTFYCSIFCAISSILAPIFIS